MFKLYRFENMLYSMKMTGSEIDGFLEHAAGLWFNKMKNQKDNLLLYKEDGSGRLATPYYNFSSAAGIDYSIDVSKENGKRVNIHGFSNGDTFHPEQTYHVAINSYRGNGGGGHLTEGAGIPEEELAGRVSWSTDRDLRFHLMDYLGQKDTLKTENYTNWHCFPSEWVSRATLREKESFQY
jgi:2',3'-cyclic-nucleotide 2'-phosphodiesterase/3'-nucleotidase